MSRNKILHPVIIVAILMLLAITPTVHGQSSGTVTIQLGSDTGRSIGLLSEIPQGWSGDASTEVLPFGNYIGPISGNNIQTRTYLWFPLSSIPSNATLTSASLEVYVNEWPFAGSADLGVYRVVESWNESLSWASRPTADNSLLASTIISSAEGWVSWNVTSLLQSWRGGTDNFGLMLGSAPAPDNMAGNGWAAAAVGRTASDASHAPRLVVSYSLSSPTPVPWAGPADIPEPGSVLLLAGGLAAMAGYIRLKRR